MENPLKPLAHALCLAAASLAFTSAFADEPVDTIRTAGKGEVEKVSNFVLFSSSKKFAVQVPGQIATGDSFAIQYNKDGALVREQFTAVSIAMRGNLCWVHSKHHSSGDIERGDTIYVQPCARLQ